MESHFLRNGRSGLPLCSLLLWILAAGALQVGPLGGSKVARAQTVLGGQVPGDCNQDGFLDLSDALCILGHLFLGSPASLPCGDGTSRHEGNVDLLDINDDGSIDLSDGVRVLTFLFLGGPPPALGTSCTPIAGCPERCSIPASRDMDRDGIGDDDEREAYFGYDFVELEDYSASSNILNYQYGVILVGDGSYVRISASLEAGSYSFYISGTADVEEDSTLEAINLLVDGQSLQNIERYWSRHQSGTLVATEEFRRRKPLYSGGTAYAPGDILYDPESNSFYLIRVEANIVNVWHYDLNWNHLYDMGDANHDHLAVSFGGGHTYRQPRLTRDDDYFYVAYSIGRTMGRDRIILRQYREDWKLEREIYSAANPLVTVWGDLDYDRQNSRFLITSGFNPLIQIDRYDDSWAYQDSFIIGQPGETLVTPDLHVSTNGYLLVYTNYTDPVDKYIVLRRALDPGGLVTATPVQLTMEPGIEDYPSVARKGGDVYVAYSSDETWDGGPDRWREIFLVKLDGSNQRVWKRQLTSSDESESKVEPRLLHAGGKLHLCYLYLPDEPVPDPPQTYYALFPGQVEVPALHMYWVLEGELEITTPREAILTFSLNFTPASYRIGHVRSDRLIIRKKGSDPQRPDTDGDGIQDGDEILRGSFVLNPDPDEDGLSDGVELALHTNPLRRDSDGDGIRDGIELGFTGDDTDPHTPWDTDLPAQHGPWARLNQDADPDTVTDPASPDSDGDGLPDGWVDGWTYSTAGRWGLDSSATETWSGSHGGAPRHGVIQRWEGEDFNGDGSQDSGSRFLWSYSPPVAETRPDLEDSGEDGLPDGWEARFAFDPLDPSDAAADSDTGTEAEIITDPSELQTVSPDGATNLEEYLAGTNPRNPDTDGDGLLDGEEIAQVIWRTNVPRGAEKFDHYGSLRSRGLYEWVVYNGVEYGHERKVVITDPAAIPPDFPSYKEYQDSVWPILELPDSTVIMVDLAGERVYVWEPFFLFSHPGFHGTYRGIVHVYSTSASQGLAELSQSLHRDFAGSEIFQTDPRNPDTDGDGLPDGEEWGWSQDPDGDGLVNARDQDLDGDELLNRLEVDPDSDPDGDGLTNIQDRDSDNDGLLDGREWNPFQDFDGDGQPNIFDPDSDNDGLPDGWVDLDGDDLADPGEYEDLDGDGRLGSGETSPLDVDTDADGLWDGFDHSLVAGARLWRTFFYYHQFFYLERFNYSKLETYRGELSALTDPRLADTDGDGALDGDEVYGWELVVRTLGVPTTAGDYHPSPPPYVLDYASGGWPGARMVVVSDPRLRDTDDDGLDDGVELEKGTRPDREDSDLDGIPDAAEVSLTFEGKPLDPVNMDSDFDYLPDGWVDFDGDGTRDPFEGEDLDTDGIVDAGETSPVDSDVDGDGLRDGLERGLVVFRATAADYLDAGTELAVDVSDTGLRQFGFSRTASALPPLHRALGFSTPQGFSLFFDSGNSEVYVDTGTVYGVFGSITGGQVPLVVNPVFLYRGNETFLPVSNPRDPDPDGDGLSDGEEFYLLSLFPTRFRQLFDQDGDSLTNFYDPDSDGDGLPDRQDPFSTDQAAYWWVDLDGDGLPCALDRDSDNDGHLDAADPTPVFGDQDLDGALDTDEPTYGLDPTLADTDGDGLIDGREKWDQDTDGDGLFNGNDPDSDQDGLADGWMDGYRWNGSAFGYDAEFDDGQAQAWEGEDFNRNGLLEPEETSPILADTDSDGLWDGENITVQGQDHSGEITHLTDPRRADTDGDGLADGAEVHGYYLDWNMAVPRAATQATFLLLRPGDYRLAVPLEMNGKNDTHHLEVKVTAYGETDPQVTFGQDPLDVTDARYMGYLGVYRVNTSVELGRLNAGIYEVEFTTDMDSWLVGLQLERRGLDPASPDTDGDGLADGAELSQQTSPGNRDTDRDGLRDGFEVQQGIHPLSSDSDGDLFPDGLDLQPSSLQYSDLSGIRQNWRAFRSGFGYQNQLAPHMDRLQQRWRVYNGRHSSTDYRDDVEYVYRYAPTAYWPRRTCLPGLPPGAPCGTITLPEKMQSTLEEDFWQLFPYYKYEIYRTVFVAGPGGFYQNQVEGREVDDYWYFVYDILDLYFQNSVPVQTDLRHLLTKVTLRPGADQSFTLQFFSPLLADSEKEIFFYFRLYHEGDYDPFYEGAARANPVQDVTRDDGWGKYTRTLYSATLQLTAEFAPIQEDQGCYLFLAPMVVDENSEIVLLRDYETEGQVLISAVASLTQTVISRPVLILTTADLNPGEIAEAYLEGDYPVSGTGAILENPALFHDLDGQDGLQEAISGGGYSVLVISSSSHKKLALLKNQLDWPAHWVDHSQIDYEASEYWGHEALVSRNWLIGYDSFCLYRDVQETSFYSSRPLTDDPSNMTLPVQEETRLLLSKYTFDLPERSDGGEVDQLSTIYTASTVKTRDAITSPVASNGDHGWRKPVQYQAISIIERRDDPQDLHLDVDADIVSLVHSRLGQSNSIINLLVAEEVVYEAALNDQQGVPDPEDVDPTFSLFSPKHGLSLVDIEIFVISRMVEDSYLQAVFEGAGQGVMAAYYFGLAYQTDDEFLRQYYADQCAQYGLEAGFSLLQIYYPWLAGADLATMGLTVVVDEVWEPWPSYLRGAGITRLLVQYYYWYGDWALEIIESLGLTSFIEDALGIDLPANLVSSEEKYINAREGFERLVEKMEELWTREDASGNPDPAFNMYIGRDPPPPPED